MMKIIFSKYVKQSYPTFVIKSDNPNLIMKDSTKIFIPILLKFLYCKRCCKIVKLHRIKVYYKSVLFSKINLANILRRYRNTQTLFNDQLLSSII